MSNYIFLLFNNYIVLLSYEKKVKIHFTLKKKYVHVYFYYVIDYTIYLQLITFVY